MNYLLYLCINMPPFVWDDFRPFQFKCVSFCDTFLFMCICSCYGELLKSEDEIFNIITNWLYSYLQASLDLQYTEDEIYELSLAREPRNSTSTVSINKQLTSFHTNQQIFTNSNKIFTFVFLVECTKIFLWKEILLLK